MVYNEFHLPLNFGSKHLQISQAHFSFPSPQQSPPSQLHSAIFASSSQILSPALLHFGFGGFGVVVFGMVIPAHASEESAEKGSICNENEIILGRSWNYCPDSYPYSFASGSQCCTTKRDGENAIMSRGSSTCRNGHQQACSTCYSKAINWNKILDETYVVPYS